MVVACVNPWVQLGYGVHNGDSFHHHIASLQLNFSDNKKNHKNKK